MAPLPLFFRGYRDCPSLLQAFLDTMTINVTELLRNPECFEELARDFLPPLLAIQEKGPLSVWSAGCSYGAETYALALLLHEVEPSGGAPNLRHRIDQAVLARADEACFTEADMAQVSPARRQAHFSDLATGTRRRGAVRPPLPPDAPPAREGPVPSARPARGRLPTR